MPIDAPLADSLLERLRTRAADPAKRTDSDSLMAGTTDLGALLGDNPQVAQVLGAFGQSMFNLKDLLGGLGVEMPFSEGGQRRTSTPLPAPCTEAALTRAEADLRFPVPTALRQLYLTVADGGFGPGDGLLGLQAAVAEYRDMTTEPAGPMGQPWPAALLPISNRDPGYWCLNVETGEIVDWDPEELGEGQSNRHWLRSFKVDSPDLASWLEKWLDAPTLRERMQQPRPEGGG